MRTFILALAILAPAAAASAGERASDAAFLQASRCAAYSGVDGDAVLAIVAREAVGRQELVRTRAETEAGQIVRKVRAAKTGAVRAAMDAERSEACAAVAATARDEATAAAADKTGRS